MSKTLTASEQAALLRYASSLPEGHGLRDTILAAVKVASGGTWGQRLETLQENYMAEVVAEAVSIIKSEGGEVTRVSDYLGFVKGTGADKQPITLRFQWQHENVIESSMTLGQGNTRKGKHVVLSLSPSQVAAESMYKHFQGLLP
jgi:hypothetical protein